MANLQLVRRQVWDVFLRPTAKLQERFVTALAPGVPSLPAAEQPIQFFSVFVPEHVERALAVADRFMASANRTAVPEGLQNVLDFVERQENPITGERENPELLHYALMVFIAHHPAGRLLTRDVPPLAAREPQKVTPSRAAQPGAHTASSAERGAERDASDGLEWFREDPFANEHHEHWHVVYPTQGVPDGKGGRKVKDRHGELFFYMHQQMLARYDAERLGTSDPKARGRTLQRVHPFGDYREVMEGYTPNLDDYSARPPDQVLSGVYAPGYLQRYSVADHEVRRARILRAVESGVFEVDGRRVPVDIDKLGATVEPTIASVSPAPTSGTSRSTFYGNLHGSGHLLIGLVNNPFTGPSKHNPPGVMLDTATAIRDPIFWRWHKHIDDLAFAWQERQPPHDFADRPYVTMRKRYTPEGGAASMDIMLTFLKELPVEDPTFDLQLYAQQQFGGAHWDTDFTSGQSADVARLTSELHTMVTERSLGAPQTDTVRHLIHEEFVYLLRVENRLRRHTTATVRIFLAPRCAEGVRIEDQIVEDRRAWIEMDKFLYELGPLERAVIARRGSDSAIVRKPAEMKPLLSKPVRHRVDQAALDRLGGQKIDQALLGALATLKDAREENTEEFLSSIQRALGRQLTGDEGKHLPAILASTRVHDVDYRITEPTLRALASARLPTDLMAALRNEWIAGETHPDPTALATSLARRVGRELVPAELQRIIEQARRSAQDKPQAADAQYSEPETSYCTCGWPHNLLVPRGTEAGMPFRLMAVLTDWDVDRVGPESCCGSVSYCGALDRYPDRRPMGYPFDRPFEHSVTNTVVANANMAFRDIIVRHLGDERLARG